MKKEFSVFTPIETFQLFDLTFISFFVFFSLPRIATISDIKGNVLGNCENELTNSCTLESSKIEAQSQVVTKVIWNLSCFSFHSPVILREGGKGGRGLGIPDVIVDRSSTPF